MKKGRLLFIVFCVGVIAAGLIYVRKEGLMMGKWQWTGSPDKGKEAVSYQCPMHPHIVQDQPGTCPICSMELQATGKEGEGDQHQEEKRERKILYYQHPMNPAIRTDKPAKDEMGMDFIPVYEEGVSSDVAGRATIKVAAHRQQLIGVTYGLVSKQPLIKTILTVGRVAYDPELYQSQQDYVSISKHLSSLEDSRDSYAYRQAQSSLEAARTRLRLLGLSENQIQSLGAEDGPDARLLLTPGDGKVWVYFDVYEQELPYVKIGQNAEISLPSEPGRALNAEIVAIDPVLDPKTRTAKARAVAESAERLLHPGMYLNAKIQINLGERLVIPKEALMDSGIRQIVYVTDGDKRFEPREVMVGYRGEKLIEILKGVSEGEKIVTSGNFLIDSESQLRGAAGGSAFYSGKEALENGAGKQENAGKGAHQHD